jgi:copper chaperone CopZ
VAAALKGVDGVQKVTLATGNREATVLRKAGVGADKDLDAAVRGAGFGASLIKVETVKLKVDGLDCAGCEERANKTLRGIKGTRRVSVSKVGKSATVTYEVKRTSLPKMLAALKKAGFPASKSS